MDKINWHDVSIFDIDVITLVRNYVLIGVPDDFLSQVLVVNNENKQVFNLIQIDALHQAYEQPDKAAFNLLIARDSEGNAQFSDKEMTTIVNLYACVKDEEKRKFLLQKDANGNAVFSRTHLDMIVCCIRAKKNNLADLFSTLNANGKPLLPPGILRAIHRYIITSHKNNKFSDILGIVATNENGKLIYSQSQIKAMLSGLYAGLSLPEMLPVLGNDDKGKPLLTAYDLDSMTHQMSEQGIRKDFNKLKADLGVAITL